MSNDVECLQACLEKSNALILIAYHDQTIEDGLAVRFGFAIMAPVLPLLVLSSCLLLEIFATGSGITAMLKAEDPANIFLPKLA